MNQLSREARHNRYQKVLKIITKKCDDGGAPNPYLCLLLNHGEDRLDELELFEPEDDTELRRHAEELGVQRDGWFGSNRLYKEDSQNDKEKNTEAFFQRIFVLQMCIEMSKK